MDTIAFEKRQALSLRLPPSLREQVRDSAVANRRSLTREIQHALEIYMGKTKSYEAHP